MKKIITTIALAAIIITSNAQPTPNAGFESWTHHAAGITAPAYDTPDSWNTLNATIALSIGGAVTCYKATAAGEYHGGAAAIKLVTASVLGQTANGIATTGTINTTTFSIAGGIAYTGRPDSIVGFYRCAPVGVDSGFVELQLLGAGGGTDTVGYVRFKTTRATVSTYHRFSAHVNYRSTNPVVTALWIMSSSADATTHVVNSTLWVDDLSMVFASTVGIEEHNKQEITVGPNPASNYLLINNPYSTKGSIAIYDVTGRKISEQQFTNSSSSIDVSAFPAGLYFFAILDENKNTIKTEKIIVTK
jgi:hypothetical protein